MNNKTLSNAAANVAQQTTLAQSQATEVEGNKIKKSTVNLSFSNFTTLNSGLVVPVYLEQGLPGDVFKINVKTLIRMSQLSAPVMDNPIYDINFFQVPIKQIWPNFPKIIGTTYDGGNPEIEPTEPSILLDDELTYDSNDMYCYMGMTPNIQIVESDVSALPARAYIKIWNEWYRDENFQGEIDWTNNENKNSNVSVKNNKSNNPYALGKGLLTSQVKKDYFTSCLPFIQKGDAPTISVLDKETIQNIMNNTYTGNIPILNADLPNQYNPLNLYLSDQGQPINGVYYLATQGPVNYNNTTNNVIGFPQSPMEQEEEMPRNTTMYYNLATENVTLNYTGDTGASAFNITELRNSLVRQHTDELLARTGNRFIESLYALWGVQVDPLEIGRTKYLGGESGLIQINNVTQTAPATNESGTQLGNLGAVSITGKELNDIEFAIDQNSLIIGMVTIRTNLTYSTGFPKQLKAKKEFEWYNPMLNGISEQPIFKKEIYLTNNTNENNEIWGYNQPFADLKYRYNIATGLLSQNANLGFGQLYTYQWWFSKEPTLGMVQYPVNAIESTMLLNNKNKEFIQDFLAQFAFSVKVQRDIPLMNIPGVNKV